MIAIAHQEVGLVVFFQTNHRQMLALNEPGALNKPKYMGFHPAHGRLKDWNTPSASNRSLQTERQTYILSPHRNPKGPLADGQ
jgi:hypothetical protein